MNIFIGTAINISYEMTAINLVTIWLENQDQDAFIKELKEKYEKITQKKLTTEYLELVR